MKTREYQEGRQAYLVGKSIEDNPYIYSPIKRRYDHWHEGYVGLEKIRKLAIVSMYTAVFGLILSSSLFILSKISG